MLFIVSNWQKIEPSMHISQAGIWTASTARKYLGLWLAAIDTCVLNSQAESLKGSCLKWWKISSLRPPRRRLSANTLTSSLWLDIDALFCSFNVIIYIKDRLHIVLSADLVGRRFSKKDCRPLSLQRPVANARGRKIEISRPWFEAWSVVGTLTILVVSSSLNNITGNK